jgi:hypothetical protein
MNLREQNAHLFEEVGLLPEVFDVENYESLSDQQKTLHALLGRLRIATLLRVVEEEKWKEEVEKRCKTSLLVREVLETLLKRDRVVREHTNRGLDFRDWRSSFAESHKVRALRALISDDLSGSDPSFKPQITNISKIITEEWWTDPTLSAEVSGAEESFLAAIRLPLHRAARIEIVDPFLLPTTDRSKRLLELITKETVLNPRLSAFKIHSSFKALDSHADGPHIHEERIWRYHFETLSQLLANNDRSARVFIWDHFDLPDNFHDRYLLTELGSCSIGRGFQVLKGVKNRFYRLDHAMTNSLQTVFRADINSTPKPALSFRIGTPKSAKH